MAIENIEQFIGLYDAAEDLRSRQYHGVRLNTISGVPRWQLPYSSGLVQGVLTNTPNIGEACRVQVFGIAKVAVGSFPILGGRPVGFDDNGRLVEGGTAATTIGEGQPGELIEVLLGGGGASFDNFSYQAVSNSITVPLSQQMIVHGFFNIDDQCLNLNGELILED